MIYANSARQRALEINLLKEGTSFNKVALAIDEASSLGNFSVTVPIEWDDQLGIYLGTMGYSYNYNDFTFSITINW